MNQLRTVWASVQQLLNDGISLIPVRDKPQLHNGREYPAKTPYSKWKEYQKRIISEGELFHQMAEIYDTTAVAMLGGKVSGNLEIIDIDVKNWPGIDVQLFSDIKALLPHLFPLLRIHQSPSKGYHIPYRISDHEPEGNLKLAYKADAKEAAIETRGEGGYVLCPPSMNYTIVKENPMPVITWAERCSLIAICEGYNERRKIIAPPTTAKNDFYEENPFEHFNGSPAAEKVLTDNGWSVEGSSNNFIWFTRPGKKSGVSASFNRSKRVYYIFTSSTEFEPSKGYQPATALSILQFNGDKKKTYSYLINEGYGKIRHNVEQNLAKKLARQSKPIPANFSQEAAQTYTETTTQLETLHPYGIFWATNEDDKIIINREQLMLVANYLGFRYHAGNVVRVVGQLIHKIDEREFQDALKAYIQEPDNDEYFKIANSFEAFLENHGKYTMKRLPILDTSTILTDTASTCFKFYNNGYLIIDADRISFQEYDGLENHIWSEKVQNRDYNNGHGGKYVDFLTKAIGDDLDHVKKCVGFLSHEYKDETTGYIIVLTEQCENPKDGGGSGKNVFSALLKHTTTYTSKPGSQTKFDEKFFQSWNGQKIFCISDVPKNFDFSFLKEPSTGSFIWKKLFKDEVEISNEDAPKFLVQTNFSYEISDGGLRRRIIPIEFTDFFTHAGGLDVHYGCHFPRGWTAEDWAGFDNFIAESIQSWIAAKRKLIAPTLTTGGWLKQFEQTFGTIIVGLIDEYWNSWIKRVEVTNSDFKIDLDRYYLEQNTPKPYQPSSRKINEALREWAKKHGYTFTSDHLKRENGVVQKSKLFMETAPF